MKILVAIPHFHAGDRTQGDGAPETNGLHRSQRLGAETHALILAQTISNLHEHFGPAQCILSLAKPEFQAANESMAAELDIVICHHGERHVFEMLAPLEAYFQTQQTSGEPRMLGFECHAVLRERLGDYDWYCYLEDDLFLHDPWLFAKLKRFNELASDERILLPNRFERTRRMPLMKAYIDGPLVERLTRPLPTEGEIVQEMMTVMGQSVVLRRAQNPHAGCFFLSAAQMEYWMHQPGFLDRDVSFVSSLESAATLSIAKHFEIFKPAPRFANFLEVEHAGSDMIERLVGRAQAMERREQPTETSEAVKSE
jgi:hypothetical protein